MKREAFGVGAWGAFLLALAAALTLCVTLGSVNIAFGDTVRVVRALIGGVKAEGAAASILAHVRIPRVLAAALVGAALALAGAAMQGLLRNPLADGGTLGVSSGAALGAVAAIALGIRFPGLPFAATMVMAVLFAFLSMLLVLSLSYNVDHSFSTHTIILMGVIFSMFAGSFISLLMAFSGEKIKTIAFWTMGSLQGVPYLSVCLLAGVLFLFGSMLFLSARELNALAMGEENAYHLGVPVKRVKLRVLVAVSVLIGVSVAVGGAIGFAGLIVPHTARLLFGPNHRRLLPASAVLGAVFLMLCDLAARTLLSPVELPIGVVTSMLGAVVFVGIFKRKMSGRGA